MKRSFPILILGAGAAGIACARDLSAAGLDYGWVEARNRFGGRIFSHEYTELGVPVELGAAFVHGAPSSVLKWLERLKIPWYDVEMSRHVLNGKKLNLVTDIFAILEKVNSKLDPKRAGDRTLQTFLDAQHKLDPKARQLFTSFVEGFHAADLRIMGEKGLARADEVDEEALQKVRNFRLQARYDSLLNGMLNSFDGASRLQMQTIVRRISWKKNRVRVTCQRGDNIFHLDAKKLVITLPIGVLKSGSIEWDPVPSIFKKLFDSVMAGHVQKIQFVFHERFWEKLTPEPISFVQAKHDDFFPAWWSFQPFRAPTLVAWQGGPKAEAMGPWSEEERVGAALKSLSRWSGRSAKALQSEVVSWHTHNWSNDPFSFGAYSYIAKGGLATVDRLAKPMEGTLYFAGEATRRFGDRGTVSGALESGELAAKHVISDVQGRN